MAFRLSVSVVGEENWADARAVASRVLKVTVTFNDAPVRLFRLFQFEIDIMYSLWCFVLLITEFIEEVSRGKSRFVNLQTRPLHANEADRTFRRPLGPLGFEGAQHRQTLRPSVDGTRSKALRPFVTWCLGPSRFLFLLVVLWCFVLNI